MMILELNILFCGVYFFTRFVPIMFGNFKWLDGKPFEFDNSLMQFHNIMGMWLHILAIPYCLTDNYLTMVLWNSNIIVNVLVMNIAGFYFPHSRKLSTIMHWIVSIALSTFTLMGISNPYFLMKVLWVLDCFSVLMAFNKTRF